MAEIAVILYVWIKVFFVLNQNVLGNSQWCSRAKPVNLVETSVKSRPPEEEYDEAQIYHKMPTRTNSIQSRNCAQTLLSLAAEASRSSDSIPKESDFLSPVDDTYMPKEISSSSSSLSAMASVSSSVSASFNVMLEEAQLPRKRIRLSQTQPESPMMMPHADSTPSGGGTKVSSWMKMTQKLLCESSLFPVDVRQLHCRCVFSACSLSSTIMFK